MSAPRRVLHVIDSFDLGGAQTFLLSLMKNHDPSLFMAEVAAMHGHGVFESEFQKAGIRTHSLSPGKFPPLYFLNFLRLIHREKFDILHFHLFGANDQCNDASRDQNSLLLAADALANKGASRLIAVSESVRRYLLEHEDVPFSKVEMIPNGLDAEEFVPASALEKELARQAWNIPDKSFVIGGVGRLVPQKNFKLLLDVATRLLPQHPNLLVVIAGSGPLESELRGHAAALGIAEEVRFLGHVSGRASLYHALDALLMPSDFEGTPMALLEAMACGLPVVASSVDGIAEVCTDGIDALLLLPGDLNGFAKAMERVIKDESLRERLGANARRRVLDSYEIRGLVRRIETLYEQILNE